jgi:hypothetical protein
MPKLNLHELMGELAASNRLPAGVTLDGLGARVNLRRQEKKRICRKYHLSGRQWTRLRKLLGWRTRHEGDPHPKFSTDSNKVAW